MKTKNEIEQIDVAIIDSSPAGMEAALASGTAAFNIVRGWNA